MQFEQQTIEIRLSDQTHLPIPAMVALGTGLAYHHVKGDANYGYMLTHVKTGYALVDSQVATKEEAQCWLERVAPLVDWTRDWPELRPIVSGDVIRRIREIAESIQITTMCERTVQDWLA